MIIGIGVDLVAVERIQRLLGERRAAFIARVYTPAEIEYCESQHEPHLFYAARFAAKEAFLKAIGTGLANGMTWQDFSVERASSGAPIPIAINRAAELLAQRGGRSIHLSLSHDSQHAIAFVVIED
jgi:holo-[acyl-carrier protein] synthase